MLPFGFLFLLGWLFQHRGWFFALCCSRAWLGHFFFSSHQKLVLFIRLQNGRRLSSYLFTWEAAAFLLFNLRSMSLTVGGSCLFYAEDVVLLWPVCSAFLLAGLCVCIWVCKFAFAFTLRYESISVGLYISRAVSRLEKDGIVVVKHCIWVVWLRPLSGILVPRSILEESGGKKGEFTSWLQRG